MTRASRLRLVPLGALGDDRLGALAAAGDRRAFAAIYERHHQALYRYCRSMLGNDSDARDAVQSVMVSALRALDGERRTIKLKPWLYRIAHNEAVSLLRKRRGESPLDAAAELPDLSRADHATRERLRELTADLGELPDQQRGALVMRELGGLEYGEIGAALGISPAAVTRAVYDARQGLHEFADGRVMSCDHVRELVSARDGRALRARKVRGHLRGCSSCAAFQTALRQRPRDLAMLAPALPAAGAASLLQSVWAAGSGGTSTAGAAGTTAVAAKSAGAWVAVKAVAVTATAVVAGAGAVKVVGHVAGADGGGGGATHAPAAKGHHAGHAGSRSNATGSTPRANAGGRRHPGSTHRDHQTQSSPAVGAGPHTARPGAKPSTPGGPAAHGNAAHPAHPAHPVTSPGTHRHGAPVHVRPPQSHAPATPPTGRHTPPSSHPAPDHASPPPKPPASQHAPAAPEPPPAIPEQSATHGSR